MRKNPLNQFYTTFFILCLSVGTATIKVTSDDGSYSATSTVYVVKLVEGISIDEDNLRIYPGDSLSLTPRIIPTDATNPRVYWLSSNPNVLTVDNTGRITGVSPGNARITCVAVDSSTAGTSFEAYCNVEVLTYVAGLNIREAQTFLYPGETETLHAFILPDDATNKEIEWSSSDVSVFEVSQNGEILAISPGNAKVTVKAKDGSKAETSADVTVNTPVSGVIAY